MCTSSLRKKSAVLLLGVTVKCTHFGSIANSQSMLTEINESGVTTKIRI